MTTADITEYTAKRKTDIEEVFLFPDGSALYIDDEHTIAFDDVNEITRWADACGDRGLVSWLIAQSVFTGPRE